MKKVFLNIFGDLIAKIYISIIKKSIDNYYTKTQLNSAQIGIKTFLYGRGTILFSENIKIGDYCRIGENYFFHGMGGIKIGDNTILSRNVTIYSANHNYLSNNQIPYDDSYISKQVIIGNSVWIGMNVCILPGVEISDGAIIGMGAIISKNVGIGEIVVGSSQRVVGSRDINNFENLKTNKQYYGKFNN